MPTSYPFTSGPFANNSSQSVRLPGQQPRQASKQPPSMAQASSKSVYPISTSNSSSTTNLLPPSASRGSNNGGVQAAFSKGPPSLRNMPSSTSLVCIFALIFQPQTHISRRTNLDIMLAHPRVGRHRLRHRYRTRQVSFHCSDSPVFVSLSGC